MKKTWPFRCWWPPMFGDNKGSLWITWGLLFARSKEGEWNVPRFPPRKRFHGVASKKHLVHHSKEYVVFYQDLKWGLHNFWLNIISARPCPCFCCWILVCWLKILEFSKSRAASYPTKMKGSPANEQTATRFCRPWKVAFFLSIHPMRAQNTPLNSILFNVEMLLISTAVSRMH